jgi:hypothetical protein
MTDLSLPRRERIYSIDVLRGITIFLMLFVNDLGGVNGVPDEIIDAFDADAIHVGMADRFIDGAKFNMTKWESSLNGTYPAIDMVPKDIIMCPWHYDLRGLCPICAIRGGDVDG